jgi:hypothetical protein
VARCNINSNHLSKTSSAPSELRWNCGELEGILFEKLPALHPPSSLHIVVRTYQFRQKRHKDGWIMAYCEDVGTPVAGLQPVDDSLRRNPCKDCNWSAGTISRAIVSIHSLRMSRSLFRIRSYPWFHN